MPALVSRRTQITPPPHHHQIHPVRCCLMDLVLIKRHHLYKEQDVELLMTTPGFQSVGPSNVLSTKKMLITVA